MALSKKTLGASAKKQAKGKIVKIEKKSLSKANTPVKKVVAKTPLKQKVKKVVKKSAPKKVAKKVATKKVAAKKASYKKIVAKKATSKTLATTKKAPAKKAVAAKNNQVAKKATSKTLATTPKKVSAKKAPAPKVPVAEQSKALATLPSVSHPEIQGKNSHFIPEHDAASHPVTPLEAHINETLFHNKEDVAFHQENQKVRDAMPSKKSFFRRKK